MEEFEYDQFIHGALEDDEQNHNFFETKIEPFKTFVFLRDWFFNDRYNLQPTRSGVSANGDPFLVYKPKNLEKTDIKEIYIETYLGSVVLVIMTALKHNVEEYVSLEELCYRLDKLSEDLI